MTATTISLESLHVLKQKKFYEIQGYAGPFSLVPEQAFTLKFKRYYSKFSNYLLPNPISKHSINRRMAQLASHPQIIQHMATILGPDILLWGSQVIKQSAGKRKRFHVDAEYCAIDGASVWIALENVIPKQSLFLISGSHLIETSPQELHTLEGLDLHDSEAVLLAARRFNPKSKLIKVDIKDSQFVLFHGKLWHGTANHSAKPRYALNFRYALPTKEIRISKDGELPEVHWLKQRPVCLLVSGKDNFKKNRTVRLTHLNKAKNLIVGYIYHLPKNLLPKLWQRLKTKLH